MNIARWMMGAALLACLAAHAQSSNPFDPRRAADGPASSPDASKSADAAPKIVRKGILCGIRQTLDTVHLCVDGQWMGLSAFEGRVGRRATNISAFSLTLAGGKTYALGQSLGGWRALGATSAKESKK